MDYARINQVETPAISPGKLRLKLLGANHARRKDEGSDSSKTSPRQSDDMKLANTSLLVPITGNVHEDDTNRPADSFSSACLLVQKSLKQKSMSFEEPTSSKSSRESEDGHEPDGKRGGKDSCLNFEFPNGGRTLCSSIIGPFSRPLPSKWNDAEKWIPSRRATCHALRRRTPLRDAVNRQGPVGCPRAAALGSIAPENGLDLCRGYAVENVDSDFPSSVENFSSSPPGSLPMSGVNRLPPPAGDSPIGKRSRADFSLAEGSLVNTTAGVPSKVSTVCMKDMGTEMTPIPSQETSRMGTPIIAETPILLSCNSSRSSTPRGAPPMASPAKSAAKNRASPPLSDEESRSKTRREIIALGLKLGKTNITAWARSMENSSPSQKLEAANQPKNLEFETRAAAWEEAEKSKHMASFRRQEIQIKLWECNQRAKYQKELREVEVQLDKMKAREQEKIMRKLATVKEQVEAKLAAAEARKKRRAARASKQAANLSKPGHMPSSYLLCCSW